MSSVRLAFRKEESRTLKKRNSTTDIKSDSQQDIDKAIDAFDGILLAASVAWAVCATIELSGHNSMSPKTWFYMILFHAVFSIIAAVLAVVAYIKSSADFPKHVYMPILHNAVFDSFMAFVTTNFYFDVPAGFEAQRNLDIYSYPAIRPLIIWIGLMFFFVLACVFRLRNSMVYSLFMKLSDD